MSVLDQFKLDGQIAWMVGGSRGLGKEMAMGYSEAGATVVISSRKQDDAQRVADEIAGATGNVAHAIAVDCTCEDQVMSAAAAIKDKFGRIDVLLNSAGINARHEIDACPLDVFREIIDVNLTGSWLTCKAVAPVMKAQESGSVILMGSALSNSALAARSPYCASKFGLLGIVRVCALEWAQTGVRCNAICPGPFLTDMNRPLLDDPEKAKAVVSKTAMNRWGQMHEIQGAAVYLASSASTYVTGTTIYVDGGWTAK